MELLLSDIQILERLVQDDERCIFVSPLIDPSAQIGPSSLDIRLAAVIRVPRPIAATCIDLTAKPEEIKRDIERYFQTQRVAPGDAFVLHPGQFALGSTLEFIRLPCDIAARLEGRSSLGRLGLEVHSTAGFVDPGFEGYLTFELNNVGNIPVRLYPGLRVAQLCFFTVMDVQVPYSKKLHSKYGGDLGPGLSRVYEDPELQHIRATTGSD